MKYVIRYRFGMGGKEHCMIMELREDELDHLIIENKLNAKGMYSYATVIDIHKL